MFKKTLIAAAVVATTASFGAAASVVGTTELHLGVNFAAETEEVAANAVTIELERGYAEGDIITLSLAGAGLVTTDADGKAVSAPTLSISLSSATGATGAVEFLEFDGDSIKVLVTTAITFEETAVTKGATVTVSGFDLDVSGAAEATDKDGNVVAVAKYSAFGTVATVEGPKVVDTSDSEDAISYYQEFKSKISDKFDAVIDVNKARKEFTTGTADAVEFTNTLVAPVDGAATGGAAEYTVYGDFSFLDMDDDGKVVAGQVVYTGAGTPSYEFAEDYQSVTVTSTAFASGTVGITVNVPGDVAIPTQEFMAMSDVAYTVDSDKGTVVTVEKAAAGSWTLNGSQEHIPFLPFGSAYSQSVTISNTSTQAGGVDLVIYVGGDEVEVEGIATVAAQGVTDISAALRKAVKDAGLTGNLAFDVIVNAPASAISTKAVYYAKADGDRTVTK